MSFEGEHITDTSVLMYFLLADAFELLLKLLGSPIQVPIDVYDPEDAQTENAWQRRRGKQRENIFSEVRRGIMHYDIKAAKGGSDEDLMRLRQVDTKYSEGRILPIRMRSEERNLAAALMSVKGAKKYGINSVLGAGEAACVAIAHHRKWVIATDDNGAFRVMDFLHDGRTYRYERIRKLLKRAADEGLIMKSEANRIHRVMTIKSFWDKELPFPDSA